jgi:hypothetical protein
MKDMEIEEMTTLMEDDEDFKEICWDAYMRHIHGESDEPEVDDEEGEMPEFLSARRHAVIWG